MMFLQSFVGLASVFALLPSALAGFDATSNKNIAVYWGQNSIQGTQERLSFYCDNPSINIIPIAFLHKINHPMGLDFSSSSAGCTDMPSGLKHCPQIGEDIKACQAKGKSILLSIGGATYEDGGYGSPDEAKGAAQEIWAHFGPVAAGATVDRPFDNAVVDGFDLDFEHPVNNIGAFAGELRRLMDEAGAGKYLLSGAPQCPKPDKNIGGALDGGVAFDFIMVQHYNNYCSVDKFQEGAQTDFNFAQWDDWAKHGSANPNVKVLLGLAASKSAAGSGYAEGPQLAGAIKAAQQFTNFGGVMLWDMSQLYGNQGFLESIVTSLGGAVQQQDNSHTEGQNGQNNPGGVPGGVPATPQW